MELIPCKTDIRCGLALLAQVREQTDKAELLLIHGARARGDTWEQIAEVSWP